MPTPEWTPPTEPPTPAFEKFGTMGAIACGPQPWLESGPCGPRITADWLPFAPGSRFPLPEPGLQPLPDTIDGWPAEVAHLRRIGPWQLSHIAGNFGLRGHTDGGMLAYSPDGRFLVMGLGTPILWDADTGRLVRPFDFPAESHQLSWQTRFSPDGQFLVGTTICGPVAVCVWNLASGEIVRTINRQSWSPHENPSPHSLLSPDGLTAFVNNQTEPPQVFDVLTGEIRTTLPARNGMIASASQLLDRRRALASTRDGRFFMLDLETGGRTPTAIPHRDSGWPMVSPDGAWLVTSSKNNMLVVDIATESVRLTVPKTLGSGRFAVGFSADGRWLALPGMAYSVRLVNLASQAIAREIAAPVPATFFATFAFSPDGSRLAANTFNGTIFVCDLACETWHYDRHAPLGNLSQVAISPDGRLVAVGTDVGSVSVFDIETGRKVFAGTPTYRDSEIPQILPWKFSADPAWSPDGRHVFDGRIACRMWAIATGELRATFETNAGSDSHNLRETAVSPDGEWLAAIGRRRVDIWHIRSGEHRVVVAYDLREARGIQTIAFSPDSQKILVLQTRSHLRNDTFWLAFDTISGENLRECEPPAETAAQAAAREFRAAVEPPAIGAEIVSVDVTADDEWLVAGTAEGPVLFFRRVRDGNIEGRPN